MQKNASTAAVVRSIPMTVSSKAARTIRYVTRSFGAALIPIRISVVGMTAAAEDSSALRGVAWMLVPKPAMATRIAS